VLDLAELARGVQRTKSHFHRVFRKVMGVTPREYGDVARMRRMEELVAVRAPACDCCNVRDHTSECDVSVGCSIMSKKGSMVEELAKTPSDQCRDYASGHCSQIEFQTDAVDLNYLEGEIVENHPLIREICVDGIPTDHTAQVSIDLQKHTSGSSRCTISPTEAIDDDWNQFVDYGSVG
jgi:hypothetical protein